MYGRGPIIYPSVVGLRGENMKKAFMAGLTSAGDTVLQHKADLMDMDVNKAYSSIVHREKRVTFIYRTFDLFQILC